MNRFGVYYPSGHEKHSERGHPERPERIEIIRKAFEDLGWWENFEQFQPISLPTQILNAVHEPAYLKHLEEFCTAGRRLDADTYTTPDSWQLALNSAGGAISLASGVWRRQVQSGFALTRPPGHHATRDRAMGFCLLNNIALAAEYLLRNEGASRLAIVDLDLHHGNGTQDIFYAREDVFYISTHQYPHYPGTGWLDETGEGTGRQKTANIPLPPFSGDSEFYLVMKEIILPLLDRHQPEMLLVSYGFDPHWSDPLGNLELTSFGYRGLIENLSGWAEKNCGGKICLFLEGGYNLTAAADCSTAVVGALTDLDAPAGSDQGKTSHVKEDSTSFRTIFNQVKQIWHLE